MNAPQLMTERIVLALGQLDRLLGFFPRNDAKGALLFATNLAMAGVVAANFPYKDQNSLAGGLGGSTLILILLSCWQLCSVFFPHTRGGLTHSLLYFRDVASVSADTYRQRLAAVTEDDLLGDIACQIHRNAEILDAKYGHVQCALVFTLLATVPWLLFLARLAATGASLDFGGN
jgi:hypothetical protein